MIHFNRNAQFLLNGTGDDDAIKQRTEEEEEIKRKFVTKKSIKFYDFVKKTSFQ